MKYTNINNISLPLAMWLADDTYSGSNSLNKKTISATTLIKPLKQAVLSYFAPEMEADIVSFLASRKGTAVHDAVELTLKSGNYKRSLLRLGYDQEYVDRVRINPTQEELKAFPDTIAIYSEIRREKQVMDWTVTGEFDLVVNGQVRDIKNTKTYAYTKGTNDDKYIKQGSIYRWIFPDIITKDTMAIDFIFDDWSAVRANSNDYPPTPIIGKEFDLLSPLATHNMIVNRLLDIEKYTSMDLNDIEDQLPPCSDEELWRTPSEFKYYANVGAVRATKAGFETFGEAMTYMQTEKGGKGEVREIKGQVKACLYCKAFPICKQKNSYLVDGTLIAKEQA